MDLFPVYPLFNIDLVRGAGCYVYDSNNRKYLDLYGGHAVISVGHAHPVYISGLSRQMHALGYYSNSVNLPVQGKLARKLAKGSRCVDHQLFLCNSGAEAIENALKVASFHTGRKKIIAFEGAFHGRTHGALAITDNAKIRASINGNEHVITLPFNDEDALKAAFLAHKGEIAAVIIEPIQGVNGIQVAGASFLQLIERLCLQNGALFIADEIQSGYGRTGLFFAFQYAQVHPQLITVAKGMGNGFPIGGVLIHPDIKAWFGMLGTTFGGNPLACAAGIAVLDILKEEKLMNRAAVMGQYIKERLSAIKGVMEIRGQGLMIGVTLDRPVAELRRSLVYDHAILTGNAKQPDVLRLLPPLTIRKKQIDYFTDCLQECLKGKG